MKHTNMQQLVDFMRDLPEDMVLSGNGRQAIDQRAEQARKRWPTVTTDELIAAALAAGEECREEAAQSERDAALFAEISTLLKDWPHDDTFETVVTAKAARGDPLALKWKAIITSKTYRRLSALCVTACEAHPHFEVEDFGPSAPRDLWLYTGPGEAPSVEKLLDWYQMTYPRQARAIERSIVADTVDGNDPAIVQAVMKVLLNRTRRAAP
jgi:hypothetical protein